MKKRISGIFCNRKKLPFVAQSFTSSDFGSGRNSGGGGLDSKTAAEAFAARWDLSPNPTPRPIPIIPRQATAENNTALFRNLRAQSSLPIEVPPPTASAAASGGGGGGGHPSLAKSRPSISLDIPIMLNNTPDTVDPSQTTKLLDL